MGLEVVLENTWWQQKGCVFLCEAQRNRGNKGLIAAPANVLVMAMGPSVGAPLMILRVGKGCMEKHASSDCLDSNLLGLYRPTF